MTSAAASAGRRRRVGPAHFTVEGQALTRIARGFMEEGKPDSAWRALTQNLLNPSPGVVEALAVSLLDGRSKLTGDTNVGMDSSDDDDPDYRERVRFVYAGRIRIGDRWYAPYALVVHAGPEAHEYAVRRQGCNEYSMRLLDPAQYRRDTLRFYAGDGERVEFVRGYGVVIFEPTAERPMWWAPLGSLAESLKDFLAAGHQLETIDATPALENSPAPPRDYTREELDAALEAERREPSRIGAVERALAAMRAREALRGRDVPSLREEILRQAAGDMMELRSEDGDVVATVPRAPFVRWSVRRTSLWHLAPAWSNVAPENMKMDGDSRDHNDWLIGAGFDPHAPYYRTPLARAADMAMGDVQREMAMFRCTVVSGGPPVTGRAGDEVLVLPDLSPRHTERFLKARAVVAERGGELSHLAVVGREASIPVVIVPGAASKFPDGTMVEIDTSRGVARAVSEY